MGFFFWAFVVIFGIYFTFRIFGRQILAFGVQRLMKQLVKNAEKESKMYDRNYDESTFHDNVYVNDDLKVSVPKQDTKKPVTADEIAEDIEFEEIP